MKKNIFTIGLISALFLVGCTGFNQDPFKDKAEAIRNATKPTTKPQPERPTLSEVVRVQTDESHSFYEGKTGQVELQVKSFLENYSYSLSVINLDEFKGASFDAKKQLFSWTPDGGFVTSANGRQKVTLKVLVKATPNDAASNKPYIEGTNDVEMWVLKTDSAPVIKNIQYSGSNSQFFEEGTSRNLVATVEDLRSPAGGTTNTTLFFEGKLAPFATVTAKRAVPGTKTWNFDIRINLAGVDLTKSVDYATLRISALNGERQASVPFRDFEFTILTQFGTPMTTFPTNHAFIAGVENVVPFVIFDSNNEALLTLINQSAVPFGAQVTCETQRRPFQQCLFIWTPDVNEAGRFLSSVLTIETRNMNSADLRAPQTAVTIYYKVVAP